MNLWATLTVVFFTLAWAPQIYKTWNTKSVEDLSLGSLVLPLLGGVSGAIYTVQIHNVTLLIGYLLGIMCTGLLVLMYFQFKHEK